MYLWATVVPVADIYDSAVIIQVYEKRRIFWSSERKKSRHGVTYVMTMNRKTRGEGTIEKCWQGAISICESVVSMTFTCSILLSVRITLQLFLYLIKHNSTNIRELVEALLTSVPHGCVWSASRSDLFTPGEITRSTVTNIYIYIYIYI
jgi:hypothetical protein